MAVAPDLSRPIRARVRGSISLMAGVGLVLAVSVASGLGVAGPAAATPAPPSYASALSVGVRAAATATSSSTVETTVPGSARPLAGSPPVDSGASAADDRKVWAVVAGLVVVALALSLLTVRYWRQTRPVGTGSRRRPAGRHSRDADEEPIDIDDGSLLFGDLTRGGTTIASNVEPEPEPAAELLIDEAPVRRADPGVQSDHAQADPDWEPHTEELHRVDAAVPAASGPTRESNDFLEPNEPSESGESGQSGETVRPSRDARAAALHAADPSDPSEPGT